MLAGRSPEFGRSVVAGGFGRSGAITVITLLEPSQAVTVESDCDYEKLLVINLKNLTSNVRKLASQFNDSSGRGLSWTHVADSGQIAGTANTWNCGERHRLRKV